MPKSHPAQTPFSVHALALVTLWIVTLGGCSNTDPEPASVTILEPKNHSTVQGPDVTLSVQPSGFTGHFHVFIDQAPVAGGGQTLRSTSMTLSGLTPGTHTVTVQGAEDPDHHFVAGVTATAHFTLQ